MKSMLESLLSDQDRNSLTPAEKTLLSLIQMGRPVFLQSGNEHNDKPENADKWGIDRTIRANLLSWLCTDRGAAQYIHAIGITVVGAKIQGALNFLSADISFPLTLGACAIPDGIYLPNARTRAISFKGSRTSFINANGLRADGPLGLNDGFQANGAIDLNGAHIAGALDCSSATFKSEVTLVGANIGLLACTNAKFLNHGGYALTADGLRVDGGVFLDHVTTESGVHMIAARIGGPLVCTGSKFKNTDGIAFTIEGLHTDSSVHLQDGFYAEGEVRLLGARIGGQLICSGATFKNPTGAAFSAQHMEIKAGFIWDALAAKPEGEVILAYAHVGQLADDEASWPQPNKLRLNGFEYGVFASDSPQNAKSRLRWIALQPHEDGKFWSQPYEQLAKVFRNMGHESDAVKVLIAKQEDLRKFGKLNRKAKFWNWFLGKIIAHGYKPWKAFLYILFFVILGAGFFSWADSEGIMQPSKERIYLDSKFIETQHLPDRYPHFNPFMYSVDTFFPFVDLHQEDYWLPSTSYPATKYLLGEPWGVYFRIYLWIHIILGWVLSAFAVAALTGLTRKD